MDPREVSAIKLWAAVIIDRYEKMERALIMVDKWLPKGAPKAIKDAVRDALK